MKVEIVPDLIALGMTEREAKLYIAMIEKPEWRSGELSRVTGVPRSWAHLALEQMVTRQFCSKRSEGRFNFYSATPPMELKEILTHEWENDIQQKKKRVKSTLDPLEGIYTEAMKGDRSLDFIEIVKTPHRIHQRFLDLLLSAEEEILGFNRSPYSYQGKNKSNKKFNEQLKTSRDAKDKIAISKSITMYEEQYWPYYEKLRNGAGGDDGANESRIIEYLPIKMFVFDRKTTFLSFSVIDSSDNVMTQLVVYDTAYAEANCAMFEHYWDKSYTYEEWIAKLKQKK